MEFECKYIEVGNNHLFSYLWLISIHDIAIQSAVLLNKTCGLQIGINYLFSRNNSFKKKSKGQVARKMMRYYQSQLPSAIGWRKKSNSYNQKTTIWVSHEYYLNPEFHKIIWRAFWVIAILGFSPYALRVDFKGLISSKVLEKGFWAQHT